MPRDRHGLPHLDGRMLVTDRGLEALPKRLSRRAVVSAGQWRVEAIAGSP